MLSSTPTHHATKSMGSLTIQHDEPDTIIEVPADLNSREALVYLGLSETTAESIHKAWVRLNSEDFGDLCTFAKDWLEERFDAIDTGAPGVDWTPVLRRIGAGDALITAITKPGYDNARLTKSAFQWVKEAMDMRWEFLLWGEAASEARGTQLRGGDSLGFTYQRGSGQGFATGGTPAGETVLWKATNRTRAEGIWANPRRQGDFNIQQVVSSPPGDFNGWSKRYYFTTDFLGAQHYARYVKDIADANGICIVRISVPNTILEAQSPYILRFPSDEFKKTIFYSRRGESLKGKVDTVLEQTLLIGDTTKGTSKTYETLKNWTDISESHLIKLPDGQKMSQHVFSEELAEQINMHCADKTTLVSEHDSNQQLSPISPARLKQRFA